MSEVNGLYPTPQRKALMRLIHEGKGRIRGEAGEVWDVIPWRKVTAKVREFIQHGWVRALSPDEPRGPGETKAPGVTYFRVTDIGLQALAGERGQNRG